MVVLTIVVVLVVTILCGTAWQVEGLLLSSPLVPSLFQTCCRLPNMRKRKEDDRTSTTNTHRTTQQRRTTRLFVSSETYRGSDLNHVLESRRKQMERFQEEHYILKSEEQADRGRQQQTQKQQQQRDAPNHKSRYEYESATSLARTVEGTATSSNGIQLIRHYGEEEWVRSEQWNVKFHELKEFQTNHGHTRVPQTYPLNPALGRWVSNQRFLYKQASLYPERIEALESLHFEWSLHQDFLWTQRYQELKQFRLQHGHTRVPSTYPESVPLGIWVMNQRKLYKSLATTMTTDDDTSNHDERNCSSLDRQRIDWLNEVGFEWSLRRRKVSFVQRLQQLQEFRTKHGHVRVPKECEGGLGEFVMKQRSRYKGGTLSKAHQDALQELGMEWTVRTVSRTSFSERIQQLQQYKAQHGHVRIPKKFFENNKLGDFVAYQRIKYRQGTLSQAHRQALEELGFEWSLRKPPPPTTTQQTQHAPSSS